MEDVRSWWEQRSPEWSQLRQETIEVLQREDRLQQIVKLVGPDVLPDSQRMILLTAEVLKDGFLTQSAFDEKDMFCHPNRQLALLRLIMTLHRRGSQVIRAGAPLVRVRELPSVPQIIRAKQAYGNDEMDALLALERQVNEEFDALDTEYVKET